MKQKPPIHLTRAELFELVWSKPLREIAKDIGVSDVALGKSCRRNGIPLPGRGYWQQASRPPRPRLARKGASMLDKVAFNPLEPEFPSRTLPTPPDGLANTRLHMLAQDSRPGSGLDIRTTTARWESALKVFSALIHITETMGAKWTVQPSKTAMHAMGGSIEVDLFEYHKQINVRPGPHGRGHELASTGVIGIRPNHQSTHVKTLRDVEDDPLQFKIGRIATYLFRLCDDDGQRAERRRQEEMISETKALARRERQAELAETKRKDNQLLSAAEWHARSQAIRSLCDAVERHSPDAPQATEWLRWARARADALDPVYTGHLPYE